MARVDSSPAPARPPRAPEEAEADANRRIAAALANGDPLQKGGVVDLRLHVLQRGPGVANGELTDELIDTQLRRLNDGFAPTGWSFRLSSVDRTENPDWFELDETSAGAEVGDDASIKRALGAGSPKVLDVYTVSLGEAFGYTTYPWHGEHLPGREGVVIDYRTVPGVDATDPRFEGRRDGATLVHEVGHWMGLYHPNDPGGDHVEDTPPRPLDNFMMATAGHHPRSFTSGQDARMDAAFTLFRGHPPGH